MTSIVVAALVGFVAGAGAATVFWIVWAWDAMRPTEREAQQWRNMQ